jgi:hypothetical protein
MPVEAVWLGILLVLTWLKWHPQKLCCHHKVVLKSKSHSWKTQEFEVSKEVL